MAKNSVVSQLNRQGIDRLRSYRQRLDFDSLMGRLQSSSYCPDINTPAYADLRRAIRGLFEIHARDDIVDFEYQSLLYLGEVAR